VIKLQVINTPQNTEVVRHNSINYRFCNGNYYRSANGEFVIANASIKACVRVLPKDADK